MFTVMTVVCLLKSMCIPSFILIGCCISELHGHLGPYRNVLPEAVYCCFTRTTLFTKFLVCLYYSCEGAGSLRSAERRESCLKCIGRSEGRGNV